MADYDDSFYYEEHSGAHFVLTAEPTGDIDTPSFINQSAKFFKKPGVSVFKKKTLVLTDWSAEQWSEEECEEQIQYYSQLLKDEFELYVWQEPNALLKLSLNNIDLLKDKNLRKKITPVKNSHIANLMASKKIAAKQIKCLPITTVQLSKIINSQHNETHLIENIITEHQGYINQDELSKNMINYKTQLQKKWSELHFTEHFKKIKIINTEDIYQANILIDYYEAGAPLETFLSQLDTIEISNVDFDELTFLKVIPTSCKLKHLSFNLSNKYFHTNSIKDIYFKNQELSKLRTLSLISFRNPINVLELISEAPKLETLKVSSLETITSSNLPVMNLKNLYFFGNSSHDTIFAFINNAKKIEKLRLKINELSSFDCKKLASDALSMLSSLKLSGEINEETLLKIIGNTQNLKKLSLSCKNTLDLKKLPPNIFEKVDSLTLNEKVFEIDDIVYFLNKKPPLTSLTLRYGDITAEELTIILQNGQHLKSLNLSFTQNLSKVDFSSIPFLNELKSLNLIDVVNSTNFFRLTNLTRKTKNLTSLNLSYYYIDAIGLVTTLKEIKTLTSLNLSNCKIRSAIAFSKWANDISNTDYISNLDSISKEKLKALKNALEKEFNEEEKPTLQRTYKTKATLDESIDSDTTFKKTSFDVKTMFWGMNGVSDPIHNEYRIQVCNTLIIQDDPQRPFILTNEGGLELVEPEKLSFHNEDTYNLYSPSPYYSKQDITLTSDWQPLCSLSSNEHITDMHIQDFDSSQIDIAYSKRDNLYYIKNKDKTSTPTNITLDFRLTARLDRSGQNCSSNIRELINKYRKYGEGALNIPPNATGQERIHALQTQPVGACRHRSVAFKDEAPHLYPHIKVRTIQNKCHMFVEVQEAENEPWVCCDLGGYEGELKPDNSNAPTPELQQTPSTPISLPANETYIDIESSNYNTWKTTAHTETNLDLYTQAILAGKYSDSKTLVTLDAPNISDKLALLLQKQCIDTNRPVFYAHSIEDLRCSANWIERTPNSNQGTLKVGPGGALYEFIKANKNNPPGKEAVFIVNFDNLTTEEIIQFNSILDEERIVDGTPIPESFHIIGLYNTKKPGAYKGSDFLLRFEQSIPFSFTPETLQEQAAFLTTFSNPKTDLNASTVVIDLYESNDWKALLLGQWTLEGEKLIFQEGQLSEALEKAKKENLPLEIKNGPWDNPEFVHFWQQARLNKSLEPDFTLLTSKGYDWDAVASEVKWGFNGIPQDLDYLLNPNTFNQYISNYTFKKNQFYKKPGWLEEYKDKTLTLYLTRELSKNQWGQLLACAKQNNVALAIHVAPGVEIPEGLCPVQAQPPITTAYPQVFITKDSDYVVDTLKKEHDNKSKLLVLDISECEAADLLVSFKAHWDTTNKNKPRYQFTQKRNALLKALKNSDTVILKGKFKPELTDALASLCLPDPYLLINGKKEYYKGQCLFVTTPESEKAFQFSATTQVPVPAQYATKSYIHTQSEQEYLKLHPNSDPKSNWEGLKHIEHNASNEDIHQEFDLSLQASEQFEKERLEKVNTALKRPFVFIAGKTGVGKSGFIKEVIAKNKKKYRVYYGKDACEAWITDTKDPKITKVLFIDEANIEGGDFSAFKGLYNTPPGILVNGTYHTLPINHKVIFAGNPQSYGDRNLPSFFADHGGSIVFPPLSEAYLYHHVLKPVFAGTNLLEQEQENISKSILKTYRYINTIPGNAILISPRELQMMAVLASTKPKDKSYQDYYIHAIAQQCLPLQYKDKFTQWFGLPILAQSEIKLPASHKTKFILTESRKEAYQKMDDFLALRHFKQTTANTVARYAGLGGIILEGDPGIGKSQFAIDSLIANKFKEVSFSDPKVHTGDIFYKIPASMSTSNKQKVLLKAFNEGAVVIMDEMNSSPMMENLLNALLMGHDLNNNAPKRAGFMIISTQNPISMEGRSPTSTALEKRLFKIELPQYTNNEMKAILVSRGLSAERAALEVKEYTAIRNYGITHNKEPLPSFRQLLQKAKSIQKAEARHIKENKENSPLVTFHVNPTAILPSNSFKPTLESKSAALQNNESNPSKTPLKTPKK